MQDMAKRKQKPDASQPAQAQGWAIYARIDPALEVPVRRLIEAQKYPPALARVVERALKELLEREGFLPASG